MFSSKIRFPLQRLPGLPSPGTLGNVYPELNLFRFASRLVFDAICRFSTLRCCFQNHPCGSTTRIGPSGAPTPTIGTVAWLGLWLPAHRPLVRPHLSFPDRRRLHGLSSGPPAHYVGVRGKVVKGLKKNILEAFHEKLGCRVLEIFPSETLSMGIKTKLKLNSLYHMHK